jgi:hypothetical protein
MHGYLPVRQDLVAHLLQWHLRKRLSAQKMAADRATNVNPLPMAHTLM